MESDKNIILEMPFDEPAGSTTAYDYSPSRADGTVTGCDFVSGRQGQCIEFNGGGYCEIKQNIIPLTGDFTLLARFRRGESPDGITGKQLGIRFSLTNGFRESWININEARNHIAVTKQGLKVKVLLNARPVETITLPGQPAGFALMQDIYPAGFGYGLLDDLKVYNTALSDAETGELLNRAVRIEYSIRGIDFKEFGITVSESSGILDSPKLKSPLKVDWPDYHGEATDLTRKRMQAREIQLKCWMKADNRMDFVNRLNRFLEIFRADGTQRLAINIHPIRPLLFEVYNESGISISKRWSDELMTGTFTLKLKEPDPVKRIVRHRRTGEATKTLAITITTEKAVTVHWGDGTKDCDIFGENITISHNYGTDGIFYALITGVIEETTNFSTTGILVWNKI